ncbi:single-stranded DNA-binding protein [Nosocomiicoccus sp. HMSC059G07]|uniref:single-stranded DNA-binding protein n=1 Tax=Nosocomiicoccus sp. HMSC059G07 TaxID=1739531 RepID=UPI0008A3CD0F|nr:single-stranded DNA-binding protein [Nosocomiicoccus sp. HMSC059G07]OFO55640.1 single-stranded DNA-binding protein [Nosocomiicoccus sp. HMSC059G07]
MINSVNLTGRLTKDPELRVSQNNVAVGNFTLAVNRSFTDQNGERQADFINCVLFRKTAEIAKQYLSKGSMVGVTGRLQTRNYENKEGQRVYVTEVVVENLAFLETKSDNNQQSNNNYNQQSNVNVGQNPFGNPKSNITDEDLPF